MEFKHRGTFLQCPVRPKARVRVDGAPDQHIAAARAAAASSKAERSQSTCSGVTAEQVLVRPSAAARAVTAAALLRACVATECD